MKKIPLKKFLVYFVTFIILFQETIIRLLNLNLFNYIDEIFVLIIFILAFISFLKTKKINKLSLKILVLIMAFSIIGILSCLINSSFVFLRVLLSNFISVKFWLLIFAILNLKRDSELNNYFFASLEFFAKIVLIFALINIFLPNFYYNIFSFPKFYRFGITSVNSLFNHPEKYGWFMCFISIYYFSKYKKIKSKQYLKKMIIYAVFALLSFRTKVIASLVIVILFMNIEMSKINVKTLIISSFLVVGILFSFRDIIGNTYKLYISNSNNNEARNMLSKYGFKIAKDYFPLGVGFGKYGSYYAKIYYSEYYYKYGLYKIYGLNATKSNYATDTFWPSILGETGYLGLSVYILLMIIIFSHLYVSFKSKKDYVVVFAFLAYIQSICESFGEPSFNSPPQNIFLAIILGIGLKNIVLKKGGLTDENNFIKNINVLRK